MSGKLTKISKWKWTPEHIHYRWAQQWVHDFSARTFLAPIFGAFWLTLTQTLTLNNWTVKEHRIGAGTVCAENDHHEIGGAEMAAPQRRDPHNNGLHKQYYEWCWDISTSFKNHATLTKFDKYFVVLSNN